MSSPENSEKLADLEIQLSHQAKHLEELNEIVRAQWAEIDKLTRSVTLLADRLVNVEDEGKKGTPGEEPPPPHY